MTEDYRPGFTPQFKGFMEVRHVDCTNEQYHSSGPESVSNTRLKIFRDNPQDYYQMYYTGEIEKPETDDLEFGRAFHKIVLEPHVPVGRDSFHLGTLAVFRPCAVPPREPDWKDGVEERWFVQLPQPGVIRRSEVWGDLTSDPDASELDCCWIRSSQKSSVGFCAYEDFIQNGHAFRHIPEHVLSSSGSRSGKAWKQFEEDNEGEVLYKPSEWKHLVSMRRELCEHGDAFDLLYGETNPNAMRSEYTIVGIDVATGLEVRCRIDRMQMSGGRRIIIDLKTSRDSSPRKWNRQADLDGLAVQAFIMTELAKAHFGGDIEYRYVVCDKEPSYRVEVFKPPEQFIQNGRDQYMRDITRFKRAVTSGIWRPPSHGKTITLTIPEYRMKEEQDRQVQWKPTDDDELFADQVE